MLKSYKSGRYFWNMYVAHEIHPPIPELWIRIFTNFQDLFVYVVKTNLIQVQNSLWAGLVILMWKLGFLIFFFWSKYTLGIVVSWYNLKNCNIWLFIWHLSPHSGPFHQFWYFLLILFSKTTQKNQNIIQEGHFGSFWKMCWSRLIK